MISPEIFRKVVDTSPQRGVVAHSTPILMMGSCFSDNIGRRLSESFFDVVSNPFGPLYNPESVASAVERILDGRRFSDADFRCHPSGLWYSPELHSSFSSVNKEKVRIKADEALDEARRVMLSDNPPLLIFTFGTVYCYEFADSPGTVVANCHKLPASVFKKIRLTPESVAGRWTALSRRLLSINPSARIMFTVSPVRHLSEGAHANNLSKSSLLLATDDVCSATGAMYFPSYEILMDELRDYRFYAADMTHPSEVASEYIFRRFLDTFCSPDEIVLAGKCEDLYRRFAHRPLTDDENTYKTFMQKSFEKASALMDGNPELTGAIHRFLRRLNPTVPNEL